MSLSDFDHTLIYFSLFLCASLSFRRRISTVWTATCLFCAYLVMVTDAFPLCASMVLPTGMNPQVLVAVLYPIAVLALLLRLIRKQGRSFDRIFVFGASASVLLTTLLFHFVLIQKILPAWGEDGAWAFSSLTNIPKEVLQERCKAEGAQCWSFKVFEADKIPVAYRQGLEGVNNHFAEYRNSIPKSYGYSQFNDLGTEGVASILYTKSQDETRIIISQDEAKEIHATIKWAFYMLCSIAHTTWISGALLLIWFHSRLRSPR